MTEPKKQASWAPASISLTFLIVSEMWAAASCSFLRYDSCTFKLLPKISPSLFKLFCPAFCHKMRKLPNTVPNTPAVHPLMQGSLAIVPVPIALALCSKWNNFLWLSLWGVPKAGNTQTPLALFWTAPTCWEISYRNAGPWGYVKMFPD